MPSLTVVSGPNEGDYYPLGTRTMVLGRDEAASIQVTDSLVSRKHCQVRFEASDDRYHLLDMNSSNGTIVNGRQVTTDTVLEDGDVIGFGNSKVMFSTQEFPDRESALNHFRQRGERGKSTLIT